VIRVTIWLVFMAWLLAIAAVIGVFGFILVSLAIPTMIAIILVRLVLAAKDGDGRCVTYLIFAAVGAVIGFAIGGAIFDGSVGQDYALALDTAYRVDHAPWWPILAQFVIAFMVYGGPAILTMIFIAGDTKRRSILSVSPSVVAMGLTAACIAACWAAKLNTMDWLAYAPG